MGKEWEVGTSVHCGGRARRERTQWIRATDVHSNERVQRGSAEWEELTRILGHERVQRLLRLIEKGRNLVYVRADLKASGLYPDPIHIDFKRGLMEAFFDNMGCFYCNAPSGTRYAYASYVFQVDSNYCGGSCTPSNPLKLKFERSSDYFGVSTDAFCTYTSCDSYNCWFDISGTLETTDSYTIDRFTVWHYCGGSQYFPLYVDVNPINKAPSDIVVGVIRVLV